MEHLRSPSPDRLPRSSSSSSSSAFESSRRRALALRSLFGPAALLSASLSQPLPDIPLIPDIIKGQHQDTYSVPFPFMETCIARGAMSTLGGYAMGFVFGAAFSGFGSASAMEGVPGAYDPSRQVPAMQAVSDEGLHVRG